MSCPFCHLRHDPEKTHCNDPHTGALIRRAGPVTTTPEDITAVIEDLQRWREVRERLTQRNLQRKQTGKRTVLQNDSLSRAIALLLEYRLLCSTKEAS